MQVTDLKYRVIRSNRRTIQLQVSRDAEVIVRAPKGMSQARIDAFVAQHADWARDAQVRMAAWREAHPEPTEAQKQALIQKAKAILPDKLAYYSALMGVSYGTVRITGARTRYGSCNSLGNLCFSWRLMQYPDEVIDALVVHELAHRKHMNHQKGFYEEVLKVMPDYYERIKLLKI